MNNPCTYTSIYSKPVFYLKKQVFFQIANVEACVLHTNSECTQGIPLTVESVMSPYYCAWHIFLFKKIELLTTDGIELSVSTSV